MVNISLFSIVLLGLWFIHCSMTAPMVNDKIDSTAKTMEHCQRSLTYDEVHHLLKYSPCASDLFHKKIVSSYKTNVRNKRDDDDTNNPNLNNNVYAALQSTINDHRTIIDDHRRIINYLMNNTVNITHLYQVYAEQHSRKIPYWKSWRDISLLLLMIICFCIIIYFLVKQIQPLDALTSLLLRRDQKKRQLQLQNKKIDKKVSIPTQTTPIATVKQEVLRYTRPSNSSELP